jgi:hypothetical protein
MDYVQNHKKITPALQRKRERLSSKLLTSDEIISKTMKRLFRNIDVAEIST